MKPSIWTSFLIRMDPVKALNIFADAGFRYLELSTEHMIVLTRGKDRFRNLEKYKKVMQNRKVKIGQCHAPILSTIISDKAPFHLRLVDLVDCSRDRRDNEIKVLQNWFEYCKILEIPILVVHPGGNKSYKDPFLRKKLLQKNYEVFKILGENAEKKGIRIAVENMVFFHGNTLLEMVEKIASPSVGICLDTGHANISQGIQRNIPVFIKEAEKNIIATHIADNLGKNDDHLFPYSGTIEWKPIVKALRDVKYTGLFNLEVPGEIKRCPDGLLKEKTSFALEVLRFVLKEE